MGRRAGRVEHHDFAAFVRRVVRAHGRRMAETADPEDLADLVALQVELEAAIREGAQALQASGRSWADIGAALGVSRQAAQQRWGKREAKP